MPGAADASPALPNSSAHTCMANTGTDATGIHKRGPQPFLVRGCQFRLISRPLLDDLRSLPNFNLRPPANGQHMRSKALTHHPLKKGRSAVAPRCPAEAQILAALQINHRLLSLPMYATALGHPWLLLTRCAGKPVRWHPQNSSSLPFSPLLSPSHKLACTDARWHWSRLAQKPAHD